MSSDVSAVTKFFATANEGFNTTTSSTTNAAAVTVALTSVSGLTNGSVFVGVIEPGTAKEQVFTGTVDVSGSQITGVVWTKGTNIEHATGVAVVDYDTGTAFNMLRAGIQVSHDDDGTLKAGAVDNAAVLASNVVTTAKILDDAVTAPKVSGLDYSNLSTFSNPYKFSAYRLAALNSPLNTDAIITFDTESYDSNSNYDTTNGRYTVPIDGFYQFTGGALLQAAATRMFINLYKNGSIILRSTDITAGVYGVGFTFPVLELDAGDYIQLSVYTDAARAYVLDGNTYFSGRLVSLT